ncbi:hypothetical protein BDW02DRAFT_574369 [Decorospora gaudefroyi]|uniref:Heterokaryon incompatibility domain-containing protein n=1 Tax=Decorospora gaudefroyi TaxID=184978 RepID=A0A6A5K346_9PLEO|nr:hypothetical protein BDW02DRAFT_574369 [Decorospora gaudefroyi]
MSWNSTFRYHPLSLSTPQICLLRLSYDSPDSTIYAHLQNFDFRNKPLYLALSYTWGPDDPKRTISLDGQAFQVSPNLFCYLVLARKNGIDADTYLWIDQICINQSDTALDERADQDSRMDKIYADAAQVDVCIVSNNQAKPF